MDRPVYYSRSEFHVYVTIQKAEYKISTEINSKYRKQICEL